MLIEQDLTITEAQALELLRAGEPEIWPMGHAPHAFVFENATCLAWHQCDENEQDDPPFGVVVELFYAVEARARPMLQLPWGYVWFDKPSQDSQGMALGVVIHKGNLMLSQMGDERKPLLRRCKKARLKPPKGIEYTLTDGFVESIMLMARKNDQTPFTDAQIKAFLRCAADVIEHAKIGGSSFQMVPVGAVPDDELSPFASQALH
jgi:hypothetical protein